MLDGLRPFNKGALAKLKEAFDVELTYNSNAIEGNTLTLGETRLVLEEGITIGGKTMKEHLEITNHKQAIDFVESLVHKKEIGEMDVLNLHALILDRIDPQNAGFYRNCRLRISGTDYSPPNPAKVPDLMKEVYRMLNENAEPIEQAARIHMKFVDIHPFIDGNGRMARLLVNLYLMRKGYPPVIVLRAERKKYIRTIVKARAEDDVSNLTNFIAKAVERSLDIYLDCLGTKPQEYMPLTEAAKHSKYSQEYLSLLAREGKIGAVKFGRNWMITKEALEEYAKKHPSFH
ncbi:Fic family protein [Candidatus Micrarchaeota archaeon]|nr:Fic family protein [Candidatus Micrarchaeota archaeon]